MTVVEQELPQGPEIAELFAAADARSLLLYPGENRIGPSTAELVGQDVRFFVARRSWRALGCVGYVPAGNGAAELKRLFVAETARGQGLGRQLLQAAEALAALERFTALRLETGRLAAAAIALYRDAGYRDVPAFGPFQHDPSSLFMAKPLGHSA